MCWKVANANTRVYSTALTLEHTYPYSIRRIKLENSGEKYSYTFNDQLRLYNSDHTVWKTVPLTHPAGTYLRNTSLISEQIDADNLLEVAYNYQTQMPDFSLIFEGRVINETGQVLLTVPDATTFHINTTFGLPPKLIITTEFYQAQPFFDFTSTKIYSMPGLQLEHDYYPDRISRANFETSGEKYFSYTIGANHTSIYNSDHTLWKTINFEHNGSPVEGNVREISQKTLNDDDLIEVSYNYYSGDGFDSKIVNEVGAELLAIPSCVSIELSRIDGLTDKLLAQFYDGIENEYRGTAVYDIDSALQTEHFSNSDVMLYPNPAVSEISIVSKTEIIAVRIFNTNGQQVYYDGSASKRFSVTDLPQGLYLVHLSDNQGQTKTQRILVKR